MAWGNSEKWAYYYENFKCATEVCEWKPWPQMCPRGECAEVHFWGALGCAQVKGKVWCPSCSRQWGVFNSEEKLMLRCRMCCETCAWHALRRWSENTTDPTLVGRVKKALEASSYKIPRDPRSLPNIRPPPPLQNPNIRPPPPLQKGNGGQCKGAKGLNATGKQGQGKGEKGQGKGEKGQDKGAKGQDKGAKGKVMAAMSTFYDNGSQSIAATIANDLIASCSAAPIANDLIANDLIAATIASCSAAPYVMYSLLEAFFG